MAEWSYGVNDAATVKLYSHRLFAQAIQAAKVWALTGVAASADSPDNIVQLLDETQKTEGDTIKYDLIAKLQGPGVIGDNVLAGQEEALSTYQDSLVINQLRHAVLPKGAMSQQRVPFSMRDQAKMRLADWWTERLDLSMINQLCGNTNQTDTRYTGLQACVAPSTGFWIYGGQVAHGSTPATGHVTEGTLASGDYFNLSLIDLYVSIAHTLTTPIKPIRLKGMEVWGVCFLHPLQIKSLRTDISTGQWLDIQKAAIQGGEITGSPIFTGAIGMYNNVVIHEDARIPYGSDAQSTDASGFTRYNSVGTANVARGVFCGAQAACMAFGRAYGNDMRFRWFEELLDAGNQLRVTAGLIFGIKKTQFNSTDYATVAVSTYET